MFSNLIQISSLRATVLDTVACWYLRFQLLIFSKFAVNVFCWNCLPVACFDDQMAVKSAPTRTEFINNLASSSNHVLHPAYRQSVLCDMADYSTALTAHTAILHSFFVDNGLNFAERV